MTARPQNCCRNCHYTWYPRGKNLSRVCPNCGSSAIDFASTIAWEQFCAAVDAFFTGLAQLFAAIGIPLAKLIAIVASAIGSAIVRSTKAVANAFRKSVHWLFGIEHDFMADEQESQNPLALTVKIFVLIGLFFAVCGVFWMVINRIYQ